MQDLEVEAPLGRLPCPERLGGGGRLGGLALEVGDEPGQRVLAPVEDEVLGELPLRRVDLRVGAEVLRVHDGEVEAGLHRVEEEDRVHHLARRLGEPEAHVGDAQRGEDAGVLGLDAPDALQRLEGAPPVLGAAGRQREGERVEDQLVGLEPVLAGDGHGAPRDLGLALRGLGHALLVDGHADHRRPEALHERQHLADALAALLEVHRVHDAAPRVHLEGALDDVGLGRVDHEGRVHALGEQPHERAHLGGLVLALVQRRADVEDVGPALHLAAGDLEEAGVVVGEEQLLHLPAALGVHPLAHDERPGLQVERHRLHGRGELG